MAKRFTDTEKWGKGWFRRLPPKLKASWEFLRDSCDLAGAWDIDLESLAFHIGEEVSLEEIKEAFGERIALLKGDKLFLTTFIEFQYGTLSPDCKPHRPVLKRLEKLNLSKGYSKGFKTLEDKDQDKDQEKDQDQEKETIRTLLEQIYAAFPRKEGKTRGMKTLKALTIGELMQVLAAVEKYAQKCEAEKTETKFIKLFSTFANEWRDWVEYEPPKEKTQDDIAAQKWAEVERLRAKRASGEVL